MLNKLHEPNRIRLLKKAVYIKIIAGFTIFGVSWLFVYHPLLTLERITSNLDIFTYILLDIIGFAYGVMLIPMLILASIIFFADDISIRQKRVFANIVLIIGTMPFLIHFYLTSGFLII